MTMSAQLDYFIENQKKFVRKHEGKVLIIRDLSVVGIFDTPLEAYLEAKAKYENGTYLIQPCKDGPLAYTASISSHEVLRSG